MLLSASKNNLVLYICQVHDEVDVESKVILHDVAWDIDRDIVTRTSKV